MSHDLTPTSDLLCGIQGAKSVQGAHISGAPTHYPAIGKWAIELTLSAPLSLSHKLIATDTSWFILVEYSYPFGTVEVYPSKSGGITATFQHQDLNSPGKEELPWRAGKICIETPFRRLGLIGAGPEPAGNAEERIAWFVRRAIAWVRAADDDTLVQKGDPFELPYCVSSKGLRITHDESSTSFPCWQNVVSGSWGTIRWHTINGLSGTLFAETFSRRKGSLVRSALPNKSRPPIEDDSLSKVGIWWFWSGPIVLPPWQIPTTWRELKDFGSSMNIDVDSKLCQIARLLRGKPAATLLLGYPVPLFSGGAPVEVHWQAIQLPEITQSSISIPGFREHAGWRHIVREGLFGNHKTIQYLTTRNWHPTRLQARGSLNTRIKSSKVALIGCGALGSSIAEQLVRGGVENLLLIDPDVLHAENLVRHSLSGSELGENKAVALSARLATVSPFANLQAIGRALPTVQTELQDLLEDYEVILDCTGSDEVGALLGRGWWGIPRLFLSLSVGYRARRTFAFAHRGNSFPMNTFLSLVSPYLSQERASWNAQGETLEGAGCWSPLFPAQLPDILLASASAVKLIEEFVDQSHVDSRLIVLEQSASGSYQGLKRIDE